MSLGSCGARCHANTLRMRMSKLDGVRPELKAKIDKMIDAMIILGFVVRVTDGNRTVEEQKELYAQGRTKPGKIVTNCDGVVKKSAHQDGKAVDLAFYPEPYAESNPWDLLGAMGEALGLRWGGRFTTLKDRPHFELKEEK